MQAVHSFWSKPMLQAGDQKCGWYDEEAHWCSWVLSFMLAREHFPETVLVTDALGKRILVDALELPYSSVDVSLDSLADYDHRLWVLGKIRAYARVSLLDRPFIHLDGDVFLWKKPPQSFLETELFCQSPEEVDEDEIEGKGWGYYPKKLAANLSSGLPPQWGKDISQVGCVGVVGAGSITGHTYFYALNAIVFDLVNKNKKEFDRIFASGDYKYIPMLLEQYMLGVVAKMFHVKMNFLFPNSEGVGSPYDHLETAKLGYTHSLAGSKKNQQLSEAVKAIVRKRYPRYYTSVLNYLKHGLVY